MTYNAFADWTKIFGDFKAPNVLDFNQFVSHCRRNAEASAAVAQITGSSLREIADRQLALIRSNAEHSLKASKEFVSQSSPESAASRQADFAKNWLEYNVNGVREIVELGTRSAQEVFEVVNKHISEQVKEFSDAATSAQHHNKKKAA